MNNKELRNYMREVHSILFEQLYDIDRVCRENNIEYSLIAGTLLGAVRYNDFIPWDDDADIVMTRENFNKFDSIYKKQKNDKFTYDYDGQWLKRVGLAKSIEYKGITLDRVCTDIFIFDNTPDSIIVLKLKVFILKLLQGMIKDKPNYSSYNFLGKVASFATHLIGKLFSANKKIKLYEDVSRIGNKKKTRHIWYYNAAFSYLKYFVNRDIISTYTGISLHGHNFMCLSGYKEYLTVAYGPDYLTPPPIEKQVPQHVTVLKNRLIIKNNDKDK
jgi:lipopolysaccharide cholinephosphotransferase